MSQIPPMVVQRHADLLAQDWPVQLFCLSQGIQHVAYSSLGTQYMQQGVPRNPVLHSEAVLAIAAAHNASAAQVQSMRSSGDWHAWLLTALLCRLEVHSAHAAP